MHFPRVIRLDDSDDRVYETSAHPGEWAVSGAFAFLSLDMERANGKQREVFRHGFLGIGSFGWSSLVRVAEISDGDYAAVIERLAVHFVQRYGAPDMEIARRAAIDEAAFAASICGDRALDTMLSVERKLEPDGIVENFRVAQERNPLNHE